MSPQLRTRRPDSGVRVIGLRRCSRSALLGGTALRAAALVVLAAPAHAQLAPNAHPLGGNVVVGAASIAQKGNTTDITQTTGRAAIDWQSFNIGKSASVVFSQPSSKSVVLNTVVGPNPSEIAGRITANGVVAVVNQSGVIFDQGSQVDTAGLIVSAAGMTRQNFAAGRMVFDQAPHPGAAVVNNGNITIRQAGLAALVAPQVVNNGLINARLGRVVLGGATTYTLDLYGDGLLTLNVTGQVTSVQLGNRVIPALVTNAGTILADGGTVVLNASAVDGLVRTLVEAGGTVAASSVGAQAGRVLIQGTGGSVDIAGAVSATGVAAGTTGGTIVADATGTVSVASSARIDASGDAGGGLIAIGTTAARARSPHAASTLTAQAASVALGAQLHADALSRGAGGQVTILSTGTSSLGGAISVLGGRSGGNGGAVELSGDIVQLTGLVDATAPSGRLGSLLIDPTTIVVADVQPSSLPAGSSFMTDTVLSAQLAGITLDTTSGGGGDIDFIYEPGIGKVNTVGNISILHPFTINADAGNVNVDAGFTLTSAGSLAITASGGINLDQQLGTTATFGSMSASSSSSVLSGAAVSMTATTGINLGAASITATTGDLAINTGTATGGLTFNGPVAATLGNITLTASTLTINGTLSATAGVVSLNAGTGGATEQSATSTSSVPGVIDAGTLTGNLGGVGYLLGNNSFGKLGTFSATGTAGSVFLKDKGPLQVVGTVSTANALSLFSYNTAPIGDNSTLSVAGTGSLSAGQAIELGADNFSFSGGVTTNGLISIGRTSAGTLTLGGAADNFGGNGLTSLSAGVLALGAGSGGNPDGFTTSIGISQSVNVGTNSLVLYASGTGTLGKITELSGVAITAGTLQGSGSNDVSLAGAANAIASLGSFSSGGSLVFDDAHSLLTTGSVTGTNSLAITVTGAGNTLGIGGDVSGSSVTLKAPGSITQTTGLINATSGDVSLTTTAGLAFGGTLQTTSTGTVALSAGTSISDAPGGTEGEVLGGGSLFGSATTGSITIKNGVNGFATVTTLTAGAGITLADGTGVQLGPVTGTAVSLTAGGTLTQASGAISATSLTGSASSGISLGSATNSFGMLGALTAGGDLTVDDRAALSVTGSVSATGAVSITVIGAGDTLGASAGITGSSVDLTVPGTITLNPGGSVTATATSVTLESTAGGILLEAGVTAPSSGGTVSLTAVSGDLSQTAGAISADVLTGSASGTVSLPDANEVGTVTSLVSGTGVTFADSTGVTIAGPISAGTGSLSLSGATLTIGGTLTAASSSVSLTSTTGTVSESGSGRITATSLTGTSARAVTLDNPANAIGTLTGFSTTAGDFSLFDSLALSVSGTVTAGGSTPTLTLQGPSLTILSGAALDALAGTISLVTDMLTLTGSVSTGTGTGLVDIDRKTNGALTIDAGTLGSVTTNTLSIGSIDGTTSSGSLTDISLTGTFSGFDTLAVFGSGALTVTAPAGTFTAGTLTGAVGTASFGAPDKIAALDNFAVTNTTLGSLVLTDVGALSLAGTVSGATGVTLTATGLTQTGGLVIANAGNLKLEATAGTGITFAGTISAISPTAGTVTLLADAGNILEDASSGALRADTLTGSATAGSATFDVAGGNSVTTLAAFTTAAGFTLEDDTGLTVAGPLSIGGSIDIHGPSSGGVGGGSDDLVLDTSFSVTGDANFASAGGIIQLSGTIEASDGIALFAGNGIVQRAGTGLVSDSGNLSLSANGAGATTSGTLTASGIAFAGTLSAASGTGSLVASAGDIVEASTGTLVAATLTGSAASLALGHGLVNLLPGSNTLTNLGSFTTSAGFTLVDSRKLTVGGTVTAGSLATSATLALTAPTLTVAATGALLSPGGTISLVADSNSFTFAGPVSTDGTSSTSLGLVGLDLLSSGTLSLTAADAAELATGTLSLGSLNGSTVSSLVTAIDLPAGLALAHVSTLGLFTVGTGTVLSHGLTVTSLIGDTGSADFTGSNTVGTLGPFHARQGSISLADTGTLSLTGSIVGSTGVTLSADGLDQTGGLVEAVSGDVDLTSALGIDFAGSLSASTGTATLIASAGNITEVHGARLIAGTLSGTSTAGGTSAGDTSLGITASAGFGNDVGTLAGFTTSGNLALEDDVLLTITGPIVAGGSFILTGPTAGAGGGTDPVPGSNNLVLDGSMTVAGPLDFTSFAGIIQLGGTVQAGGNLTLLAANGIIQSAGALNSTGGNLSLTAKGGAPTTSGAVTASGIDFAGSLSASTGTATLIASAGNITEVHGARLIAGTLSGTSTAGGTSAGDTSLGITASAGFGNDVGTLAGFTTSGNLALEDDVLLTITGPIVAGGSFILTGPTAGAGGGTDPVPGSNNLVLDGSMTVAGPLDFTSFAGIIQLGGTVQAGGNLTLLAANGIIQSAGALNSTGGNLSLTAKGGAPTTSGAVTASGIDFAGSLSASTGTATLIASAGNITEVHGARLIAGTLSGTSTAGGTSAGDTSLGITASAGFGNDVGTLAGFTTSGNLALEDDVLLTITGPIVAGGSFILTGPTAGAGGGTDPVPGSNNLVLDGSMTVAGPLDFTSFAGIIQLGGTVQAGGNLTLLAANGIIQSAGALNSTGGNLSLTAKGGAPTTSGAVTASGIDFAGSLSASTGTATLIASAGNITEVHGARLIAGTLSGTSTAGGTSAGDTSLGITASAGFGNDVGTLAGFTTSGNLALEDDVLLTITGPIVAGGSFILTGPTAGAGGGTDPVPGSNNLVLDGSMTVAGPLDFTSFAGIIQLGGTVQAGGNLTLKAANGIIQSAGALNSTGGNLSLTATGGASTTSGAVTASGIDFAGSLSASTGTATLIASAGNITEVHGARLIAGTLSGTSTAGGTSAGDTSLGITASAGFGNDVGTLAGFTTSGNLALEDDVLLTITGPIVAGGSFILTGPTAGAGGGTDPVPGSNNLVLDGSMTVAGPLDFTSFAGIIQLGGTVQAGGNLTLKAANGIIQSAGALNSTGGNLSLTATGGASTTSGAVTASGIDFAGSLSASTGTATLIASAGNITEVHGARLIAGTLSGTSTAGGTSAGDTSLGITASAGFGNDVGTLAGFTTSGNLALEDDVLLTITGPIVAGGSFILTGPTAGAGGGTDPVPGSNNLVLDGSMTVAGPLDFTSFAGIIQLGGTVQAGGNLTLLAANGIIQSAGALNSTGGNLSLTAKGGAPTTSSGITTTGISFAGTLSAIGIPGATTGDAALVAGAGDIVEQPTGRLFAGTLEGAASAAGTSAGSALFQITAGNRVSDLGSFTTSGDLVLEDDIAPFISGPLAIGGSLDIYGSTGAGDLILDADISVGNGVSFTAGAGIIQLGGTLEGGGNVSLQAGNGIIQFAGNPVGTSVITSDNGNVTLSAGGTAATSYSQTLGASTLALSTTGIVFGGTVSAIGTLLPAGGTVSLTASLGDITETPASGRLLALTLTGAASAGTATVNGTLAAGDAVLDVASGNGAAGNSVTTLNNFAAAGNFTLEDDLSPDITGNLTAGGAIDIHGLNGSGTGPGAGAPNLVLNADVTAGGTARFDSAGGVVQTGGTVQAAGDLTLLAATGIVQSVAGATLRSTGGNLDLATASSGIVFAGTLSAASGTATLSATAGGIVEASTGHLIAATLTGNAGTLSGAFADAQLTVASGNDIGTLAGFLTTGGFFLEDDVLPTVTGPLTIGGALTLAGPSIPLAAGADPVAGASDLILNAPISVGGTATLQSFAGIVQQGGTLQAAGDVTLLAANGILQFQDTAAGASVLTSGGTLTLTASGAGTTTATGTLAAGAGSLATAGIALAGALDAASVDLGAAAGGITQLGSATLSATSLTGSASGAVSLTGSNAVGTLAGFTAAGLTLADGITLEVDGPVQGGTSVSLSDLHDLLVPGTIGAATLSLAVTGAVSETGSINATLLQGSVVGSASFTGSNSIGTLGTFSAASLTLDDTTALSVGGPAATGATILDALSIDIPGTLTASSLVLASGGAITEGGSVLVSGELSGSAAGSVSLAGNDSTGSNSNSIVTLGSFTAAGGFTLSDSADLTITGPLDGQPSLSLTDSGLLTIQGSINGAVTGIAAATLDVPGTITAGTSLSLAVSGGVTEGGSIVTPLLIGTVDGDAGFTGLNSIDTLGPFNAGSLVLNDTPDLAIVGAVVGGSSIAITDIGALTVQASVTGVTTALTGATIAVPGSVSSSFLALTSTSGDIDEPGSLAAGTLTGTAAGAADLVGSNSVATLSDFTAANGLILNDTPDLAVTGAVDGGPSVTVTDAGVLTVIGSIAGSATSLTGASLNILDPVTTPGTIDAATSLVLTATSGTITETGSLNTALLSGSAVGSASLIGTNDIATIGDFTAAGLTLVNAPDLAINGAVNGGAYATLTDTGSLTINGSLSASTISLAAAQVAAPGTVTADLLQGTVAGSTAFTGTNQIGTLGSFAASSFILNDTTALAVAGPVNGGTSLAITDTESLTIPGSITAALVHVTAADIAEAGSITTTFLGASSAGSVSFIGSNFIAQLGDISADGLALNNAPDLIVVGAVNGTGSVTIAEGGVLAVAEGGIITGSTTNLTASAMTISGQIASDTRLTLTSANGIGETGSMNAALLTGSAGADAQFNGVNQIAATGDFTVGGSFALQDAASLNVNGMLNATRGNIGVQAANITEASDAGIVTGVPGATATTGTITLGSPGTIFLAGLIDAPNIIVGQSTGAPTLVTWAGNTIITGASEVPGSSKPPFPPINGSQPGIYVLADSFKQTGTTVVNPNGKPGTIEITLAERTGTIAFDQASGLVAPRSELFLNLQAGVGSGRIDVAGLNISYLEPGSNTPTVLFGVVSGENGQPAAGAAFIQPLANSNYRFNSCPIQSINCILVSPIVVPVTNPVEDVEVTSPRRRREDDDLIIPNVGEQDF